MNIDDFENDLYHSIKNVETNDFGLLNSYLYTNIDNIQKYSTMKFVLAIINYKNKFNNNFTNTLVFTYKNSRHTITLNN